LNEFNEDIYYRPLLFPRNCEKRMSAKAGLTAGLFLNLQNPDGINLQANA
jgi:hypothetical protein